MEGTNWIQGLFISAPVLMTGVVLLFAAGRKQGRAEVKLEEARRIADAAVLSIAAAKAEFKTDYVLKEVLVANLGAIGLKLENDVLNKLRAPPDPTDITLKV